LGVKLVVDFNIRYILCVCVRRERDGTLFADYLRWLLQQKCKEFSLENVFMRKMGDL
jgi:hypothetical protein